MLNTLLTRIDNRLIHDQVVTRWGGSLGANLILVTNDAVSEDTIYQQLLSMAASAEVQTRFSSIKKTIRVIHKASERREIFLLVGNLVGALRLVDGDMPIEKLNINNTHIGEGKEQVATAVTVNKIDVDAFKRLQKLDVKLLIRRIPSMLEKGLDALFS